jgi:hypothetical protein
MENGTNRSPIPWTDSTGMPGSPWIAGSSAGARASAEEVAVTGTRSTSRLSLISCGRLISGSSLNV